MQTQILVPLDGSELSEVVLPQATTLARLTGSGLTLLQVIPGPQVVDPMAWSGAPAAMLDYEALEAERRGAQEHIATLAARLETNGLRVHAEVLDGDPAPCIMDHAAQHPTITLIAMATHGRSGLGRWVFGSVAEKVLHATPVPLLLVRPASASPAAPAPITYHTIVVPLDGSVFAEQALAQARLLATASGATLHLVAAVLVPTDRAGIEREDRAQVVAATQEAESAHLSTYLAAVAERLRAEHLTVETQVVGGRPAEAILQYAAGAGTDLIVMATHGRNGLQELWLGSVAHKVVLGARGPVLLVRATATSGHPA